MTQVIITAGLEDTVKEIRMLHAKEQELKEARQEREAIVKKIMDEAGIEELTVAGFVVKYTTYIKNQFDVTAFKRLNKSIYDMFIKHVNCRKFTIA